MKSAHLTFTLTGRYRLPFVWLLPFVYLNFTVLTLTGRNVAIVVVCVVFITYFCLFLPVQDECDGLCGDLCRLYLTCTFSYLYRTVAVTIVVVCAVCVSYLFLSFPYLHRTVAVTIVMICVVSLCYLYHSYLYRTVAVTIVVVCAVCVSYLYLSYLYRTVAVTIVVVCAVCTLPLPF